jgi:hypothetical protein
MPGPNSRNAVKEGGSWHRRSCCLLLVTVIQRFLDGLHIVGFIVVVFLVGEVGRQVVGEVRRRVVVFM